MIYDGSDIFREDQLSRMLGVKISPFAQSRIVPRVSGGVLIENDNGWIPSNLRIL
jgi:hypothetical protein